MNLVKSFIKYCLITFCIITLISIFFFYDKNNISDDLVPAKLTNQKCFELASYIDNVPSKEKNNDLIEKYTKETEEKFIAINKRYTNNLEKIYNSYNNSLGSFANSLAERKVSKESCKILIKYLVKGKSASNNYLNDILSPEINGKFGSLMNDINNEMVAVQKEYIQVTQDYSYRLCCLIPSNSHYSFVSNYDSSNYDFRSTSKNINEIIIELPFFACDFYEVISSKCFSSIMKCVSSAASSIFKKSIQNIAKSSVFCFIDGPLPVLDGISLLYVSRDIKKKYKKYRNEVASTIYNNMSEGISNIRVESLKAGCKIYNEYISIIREMKNKVATNI